MPDKRTYFALLPSDLIKQYFLNYFDMKAITTIMPIIKRISPFKKLLFKGDKIGLWRALWVRDISQYRIPTKISYKKYDELSNKLAEMYKEFDTLKRTSYIGFYFGNKGLIEYFASHGYEKLLYEITLSSEINNALRYAVLGGYNDIVLKLIYEFGKIIPRNTLLRALSDSGQGGHMDTVELLLKLAASNTIAEVKQKSLTIGPNYYSRLEHENYNAVLEGAAAGGQLDIVKLMLEKGADNYIDAINGAQFFKFEAVHKLEQLYKVGYAGIPGKLDKETYDQKVEDVKQKYQAIIDLINSYKK